MPWKENTRMSLRLEFVTLAFAEKVNISRLCKQFRISRKTGYKWLRRYLDEGPSGLSDRPRTPRHSPVKTPASMEQAVLEIRDRHPCAGYLTHPSNLSVRLRTCCLHPNGIPHYLIFYFLDVG